MKLILRFLYVSIVRQFVAKGRLNENFNLVHLGMNHI